MGKERRLLCLCMDGETEAYRKAVAFKKAVTMSGTDVVVQGRALQPVSYPWRSRTCCSSSMEAMWAPWIDRAVSRPWGSVWLHTMTGDWSTWNPCHRSHTLKGLRSSQFTGILGHWGLAKTWVHALTRVRLYWGSS